MERKDPALGVYSNQLSTPEPGCGRRPLTTLAQESWREYLAPGCWAIDATAGNGLDTAFMASCIQPDGRVFAMDIQESALKATADLLKERNLLDCVTLMKGDHSRMREQLACGIRGQVHLICFNLGYLPTGDHSLTTSLVTTLPALHEALLLLSPGGALSVIAYRGHSGGMEEAEGVGKFFAHLPNPWKLIRHVATGSEKNPGPVWWLAAMDRPD